MFLVQNNKSVNLHNKREVFCCVVQELRKKFHEFTLQRAAGGEIG